MIKNLESSDKIRIVKNLVETLKIRNQEERLCGLYFILDGDIKSISTSKNDQEWSEYLKMFDINVRI